MDLFLIIQRIKSGRETIGYGLKAANSDYIPASKNEVLKLAMAGMLINATAQRSKNDIILRSADGFDITKIPSRQKLPNERLL